MERVYIEVAGGVLQGVTGVNNWALIDWDNIEQAPEECWKQFDAETQEFIRTNYPEDYQKYFASIA